MATTKTNRRSSTAGTSNRTTGTTQPWMNQARKNNLSIGLCLLDTNGEVVQKIPLSMPQVQGLNINLRPIERWMDTHYPAAQTEQQAGRTRRVA